MEDNKEEIKPIKSKEIPYLQVIPTKEQKIQKNVEIENNELHTNHTNFQSSIDGDEARFKAIGLERFPSLQNIREISCSNTMKPSHSIFEATKECRCQKLNCFSRSKSNVFSWVSFESKDGLRLQETHEKTAQSNLDDEPKEMLKQLVSIADSITYNGLELQDPSGKMHHYFDAYLPPYSEDETG